MALIPLGVAEAIRELESRLRCQLGAAVLDVRLFGSFARGKASQDSDVDVLVLLDELSWQRRRTVIDLAADVGLERELLIMPTVLDQATYQRWRQQERPLVMAIEREGVRT